MSQPKDTVNPQEDAIAGVLEAEADMFLAEAIIEMENKTLAERRRIGKQKAHRASLQAQLCRNQRDYSGAKQWANIAYTLKSNRV